MADVHFPEIRSYNMSKIRGKNTRIEEKVRKYLFSKGFRYRKNDSGLPGSPDIVLPKYHTVVFINGCFWHAHEGCKLFVLPKSNTAFWEAKLQKNKERDKRKTFELETLGWNVIVIWECELQSKWFADAMTKLEERIING